MEKCTKCGSVISDNDPMAWKCTECGKAFRVKLSKLKKLCVLKNKPENAGKALLKCSTCGNGLDNGNEMIACKCSACGNVMMGKLRDFAGQCKNKLSNDNKNADTPTFPYAEIQIKNNHSTQSDSSELKFKLIHKICLVCVIVSIFISIVSIIYIQYPNLGVKDSENSENSQQTQLDNLDKNTAISGQKSQSSSTYTHTCEADGCYNEGTKSIRGLNGTLEYYCFDHYQELESIFNDITGEDIDQPTTFTNIRASSTTKCAHSGCNNYIAPSGDTSY